MRRIYESLSKFLFRLRFSGRHQFRPVEERLRWITVYAQWIPVQEKRILTAQAIRNGEITKIEVYME